MTIGLRRLLATAFVAALAGLGVMSALRGRRPRTRRVVPAEELTPVAAPPSALRGRSRRGPAFALVGLLLLGGLAGVVYAGRDALFGVGSPGAPLAALSPEATTPSRRPARDGEMSTGSLRTPELRTPELRAPEPRAPERRIPESQASEPRAPELRLPDTGAQTASPPSSTAPSFDVVRVAPDGEAVIAGRTAPNATVDLLIDGRPVARTQADAGGHFTVTPPALPTGGSEIRLRATDAHGREQRSPSSVAVVVAPTRDTQPLVALTSPDRPTAILSRPDGKPANAQSGTRGVPESATPREDRETVARQDPPAAGTSPLRTGDGLRGIEADGDGTDNRAGKSGQSTGAAAQAGVGTAPDARPTATSGSTPNSVPDAGEPPRIVTIDAQDGGRLFITARTTAGASVRLYLNDTLIAPATVARDGTVTFAIGKGLKPGSYSVRLDRVDPVTGQVRDRAEVPFTAPEPGQREALEYSAAGTAEAPRQASISALPARDGQSAGPTRSGLRDGPTSAPSPSIGSGSSEVFVPGIETTRIVRGDSLWRISRRTYGEGEWYTLIYDANQDQIRDPDLIYPGQVLVLPSREAPIALGQRD